MARSFKALSWSGRQLQYVLLSMLRSSIGHHFYPQLVSAYTTFSPNSNSRAQQGGQASVMAEASSGKKSNFKCPNCTAKLLIVRINVSRKRVERATCPHCIFALEPRDGNDLLSYRLVE